MTVTIGGNKSWYRRLDGSLKLRSVENGQIFLTLEISGDGIIDPTTPFFGTIREKFSINAHVFVGEEVGKSCKFGPTDAIRAGGPITLCGEFKGDINELDSLIAVDVTSAFKNEARRFIFDWNSPWICTKEPEMQFIARLGKQPWLRKFNGCTLTFDFSIPIPQTYSKMSCKKQDNTCKPTIDEEIIVSENLPIGLIFTTNSAIFGGSFDVGLSRGVPRSITGGTELLVPISPVDRVNAAVPKVEVPVEVPVIEVVEEVPIVEEVVEEAPPILEEVAPPLLEILPPPVPRVVEVPPPIMEVPLAPQVPEFVPLEVAEIRRPTLPFGGVGIVLLIGGVLLVGGGA